MDHEAKITRCAICPADSSVLARAYCVNLKTIRVSKFGYCLTKISILAKRSISRVFSLFIVPSPFFVHCSYKGRTKRAESISTGLKPH